MMPTDASCWPDHGEIDITEMVNGDGVAHGTYHWNRFWPNQSCTPGWNTSEGHPGDTALGGSTKLAPLPRVGGGWDTAAWHEYAVEWDGADRIAFVVDSVTILNISRTSSTNSTRYPAVHPQFSGADFYLILNTAVGGPWPGPPTASTVFPWLHHIDYVRVVQPM
jgi:beta-glucanase (GH16 family)